MAIDKIKLKDMPSAVIDGQNSAYGIDISNDDVKIPISKAAITGSYTDLKDKPDLTLKADKTELQNEIEVRTVIDEFLIEKLGSKVDIVSGKCLSTNDFTNEYKNKLQYLAGVAVTGSYDDLLNKPISEKTLSEANNFNVTSPSGFYLIKDSGYFGILYFQNDSLSSRTQTLFTSEKVMSRKDASTTSNPSWSEWKEIGDAASAFASGDLVIAAEKVRGAALSTRPYSDFFGMTNDEKSYIVGIVVDGKKRTFIRCSYNYGNILSPNGINGAPMPLYKRDFQGFSPSGSLGDLTFAQKYNTESGVDFRRAISGGILPEYDPTSAPLFYCINQGTYRGIEIFDNISSPHMVSLTNYVPAIEEINKLLIAPTKYDDKKVIDIIREISAIHSSKTYKFISCTHTASSTTGRSCAANILWAYEDKGLDINELGVGIFNSFVVDDAAANNFYKYPESEGPYTNVFPIFDILP